MEREKAIKKRKTIKVIFAIVALLVLFVLYNFVAITHKYGPYYGKVVDKETGEPIGGAVVLAVYYTETWWLTTEKAFYIDSDEVLTDDNGEYRVPAKRLFAFRPMHWWNPFPKFTIFKPGYGAYPYHKGVEPMYVPAGTLPAGEHIAIRLPILKPNEDYGIPSVNYDIPYEKQTSYVELINQDRKRRGYEGEISEKSFNVR